MSNEMIIGWLRNGKIQEALLGQNNYFISGLTYRSDHDTILVISAILDWANEVGHDHAARLLQKAISNILLQSFPKAIDIILSYFIVIKSRNGLPIDIKILKDDLSAAIKQNLNEIIQDEALRNQVIRLSNSYLPGIY